MAFHMKMEKKKAYDNMKRLMAERNKKDTKLAKIDNPLAKYNKSGQLTCILCSSVVRSENVWQVHINSKQHKQNIEQAKNLKELTNNFTVGKVKQKRLGDIPSDAPQEKKLKSILKNSGESTSAITQKINNNVPNIILYHNEEIKRTPLSKGLATDAKNEEENVSVKNVDALDLKTIAAVDQPIPEGFFDDPILDAKVRNIEYKDPVEEEWEKFQKEIKEEASASAEIIAGEQEEATAERQIDEIDEQMRNWSRVLDLELKKEETKKNKHEVDQMSEDNNDESDNDADIDEFLDWRAKKSFM